MAKLKIRSYNLGVPRTKVQWIFSRTLGVFLIVALAAVAQVIQSPLFPTTSAVAISSNGSISFNGTSDWLTVPASNDWTIASNQDFTVEWWQYLNNGAATRFPRIFSVGSYPSASIAVSEEGSTLYFWMGGSFRASATMSATNRTWEHYAVSRTSGAIRIFKNGVQIGTTVSGDTSAATNSSQSLYIGREANDEQTKFRGYLTDFHFVKGRSLYSSNFSVPTNPITPVSETKLLLNAASTPLLLADSSSSSRTVTAVGSPSWNAISPYNAIQNLATPSFTLSGTACATEGKTVNISSVPNASSYTAFLYSDSAKTNLVQTIANFTSGSKISGLTSSTTYYLTVVAVGDGTNYSDSQEIDSPVSYATNSSSCSSALSRTISFTSPTPLTISKSYGESFNVSAQPSAGVGDGTISYSAGSSSACTVSGAVVRIIAGTGTCSISATITAGSTYDSATTTSLVNVSVQKRDITISGAQQVAVYGENRPNLSVYSLSGTLAAGDAISVIGSLANEIVTGTSSVNLQVSFTAGNSSNYNLTIKPGTLTINPAALPSPSFGEPIRNPNGFTIPINNYNPAFENQIQVSSGSVKVTGPLDGKYQLEVTGISSEVSLSVLTSKIGYIPASISIKSGPLYTQKISLNLNGFENLKVGLSRVLKPITQVEPAGQGVTYSSLTPDICEIKLRSLVFVLKEGNCTIKATGNPSPILIPGAYATSTFSTIKRPILVATPTMTSPEDSKNGSDRQGVGDASSGEPVTRTVVIPFKYSQYSINNFQKSLVQVFVKVPAKRYVVVGYSQATQSQDDLRISLDRALEVKKSLSNLARQAEVQVRGYGSKKNALCAQYKNRCVVVYLKP